MIILGIDPGSLRTGFGIIRIEKNKLSLIDSGVFTFKSEELMHLRLKKIYARLSEKITGYKPDTMAIETAFFGKNVQSALKLGYARGAALLAAANAGLDIYEYSPREVKKAVTGNGAAAKEQVSFMVKTILTLKSKKITTDESDALGIAICHAFRGRQGAAPAKSWNEYIKNNPERVVR